MNVTEGSLTGLGPPLSPDSFLSSLNYLLLLKPLSASFLDDFVAVFVVCFIIIPRSARATTTTTATVQISMSYDIGLLFSCCFGSLSATSLPVSRNSSG